VPIEVPRELTNVEITWIKSTLCNSYSTGKDNHSCSEFPKGTKPPKEGSGGFRLKLAVCAVVPQIALGSGLRMGRHSVLLSGTSGVPEGGLSGLDRRDDRKTSPPALESPVDLPEGCMEVALAELTGILEGALIFSVGQRKTLTSIDGLRFR
jgi:hypothetical protein